MTRRLVAILAALLVALSGALTLTTLASSTATAGPAVSTQRPDRDCGDFNTQKAAQIYFLNHGGPKSDPDYLDSDGDGVACESNPCPCYTGKTPPGGDDNPGPSLPQRKIQNAKVILVIDGDTVDVRIIGGKKERLRLIGIDTPEVFGGTECGGPAASKSAKKILPKGTRVQLTSDRTQDNKDRYGRLLRYVTKSGTDVNRAQVARGHAKVYVYGGNRFERTTSYRKAQTQAKNQKRGLWGACN